jgi:hypothetical protein
MSKKKRKRIFVDPKVQGSLVLRVAFYWLVCLITITLMILCWRILTGPARLFYTHITDMWYFFGPALVASFVLLPLVVVDVVRLSNRFVGPLVRLRAAMRALARGEDVRPIRFREGDFWQEFAEEFNTLVDHIQSQSLAKAVESPESKEEDSELVGATR